MGGGLLAGDAGGPRRAPGPVDQAGQGAEPPHFSRVFARIDAEAFNGAVRGYLDALHGAPAGPLPEVTAHERERRRAAKAGKPPAAAAPGGRGRQDRPRRRPSRRRPGSPAVGLRASPPGAAARRGGRC